MLVNTDDIALSAAGRKRENVGVRKPKGFDETSGEDQWLSKPNRVKCQPSSS